MTSLARTRPRIVGRYAFHDEIASGGMGAVYFGKLLGPGSFAPVVAIKVLHPQHASEPDFVKMFFDEARLAARIRHTNVVAVLDVHDADGELFLVLEYVHGESLGRLITLARASQHDVPLPIAAAILCDVLRGLHAAHEAKSEIAEPLGIVHRDVSPQNVIVGVDGVGRVLDFGIAKATGRLTTTREGQVKGKFPYMAPEQLRGEEINRQADLYAASVVLWELLTGRRLFAGDNEGNIVTRVLFSAVAAPSSIRSDVPDALDTVVMRGLARERADRFATAREMEIALRAAIPLATPDEVGAWVSGLAFESLEQRAKVIARLDAEPTPKEMSSPIVATSAAPNEIEDQPKTILDRPRKQNVRSVVIRILAAFLGAFVVVVVIHLLPTRSDIAGTPALPSNERSAPIAASGAPSSTPSADVATTASAQPNLPEPHAQGKRRSSPAHATPHAAASKSANDCTIRNADGTIGFDTSCLRARTP